MNEPKPGYLTTEFWTVIATAVVTLLVNFGVIAPEAEGSTLEAVLSLIPLVLVVAMYIWSRTQVKSSGQQIREVIVKEKTTEPVPSKE